MKNFKKSGCPGHIASVAHIYQRTENGFLIFYSLADFLVFFTVFCTTARCRKMTVLGVCPMLDHIHSITVADSRDAVRPFVRDYSSLFSRERNTILGKDHPVHLDTFGCAIKKGDKMIRTALSYLYNNPGEKGLCRKAPEYRWTFLAYANSNHPYSEPLRISEASRALRRAIKLVDYYNSHNKYLKYNWIAGMYDSLDERESEQLTDYIISKYNCIDYDAMISLYGSFEKACLAFDSNQGSEYEIKEDYSRDSHRSYFRASEILKNQFGYEDINRLLALPSHKREAFSRLLTNQGVLSRRQADKYFRIPWHSKG